MMRLAVTTMLLLLAFGCTEPQGTAVSADLAETAGTPHQADTGPAASQDLEDLFARAGMALEAAAEARAEWLETRALLDSARRKAAEGDREAAVTLAREALFQAEAAFDQAGREATAWQRRVVR